MFCPQCGAQAGPTHRFCAQCGAALAAATPPPPPDAPGAAAPADVYAGFWPRVGAFILDYLLIVLACAFLRGVLGIRFEGRASIQSFFWVTVLALWLYKAVMESSPRQATLGKLAFDLKVTSLEGERISFLRALGRNIAQLLSAVILYIGFLMPTFTRRSQALHDMTAGTLVTRRQYAPAVIAAAAASAPGAPHVRVAPSAPVRPMPAAAGTPPQERTPAKPELPVRLTFRDALLGSGKRAVLENLSDNALDVVLEVKSPLTGAHFTRTFIINPRSYGQIGRAQGWPFARGDLVTVSHPRYRALVQTVS